MRLMKINYVLIGSNENEMYLDFWPIISKTWKLKFDIEPILGLISDNDYAFENKYGQIKRFPIVKGIDSALQSQIIRIFLPKFLEGTCLISDIDMLPLSKTYFRELEALSSDKNFLVASADHQPSLMNKMYPMCYVLGHSNVYKKIFDLDLSWEDFVVLIDNQKNGWFSDQKYIYEKINAFRNTDNDVVFLNRGWDMHGNANRRIDRTNWQYSKEWVSKQYYIDSHLLRPFCENEKEIKNLTDLL